MRSHGRWSRVPAAALLVALGFGIAPAASSLSRPYRRGSRRRPDASGCARSRRRRSKGAGPERKAIARRGESIVERFKPSGLTAGGDDFQTAVHVRARQVRRGATRRRQRRRALPRQASAGRCAAIVVSAHYDHLGMRDGATYPRRRRQRVRSRGAAGAGAASASASPWTARRGLRRLRRRGDGAAGRAGVRRGAADPEDRASRSTSIMDMVSRSDAREICSSPGPSYRPELRKPCSSRSPRGRRSRCASVTTSSKRRRDATTGRCNRITARFTRRAFRSSTSASRITPTITSRPTRSDKIDPAFFFQVVATRSSTRSTRSIARCRPLRQ